MMETKREAQSLQCKGHRVGKQGAKTIDLLPVYKILIT